MKYAFIVIVIILIIITEGGLTLYLRSSPWPRFFLTLSRSVVYQGSSRDIWSYFLTASVKPSMSSSSMCAYKACKTWLLLIIGVSYYSEMISLLLYREKERKLDETRHASGCAVRYQSWMRLIYRVQHRRDGLLYTNLIIKWLIRSGRKRFVVLIRPSVFVIRWTSFSTWFFNVIETVLKLHFSFFF